MELIILTAILIIVLVMFLDKRSNQSKGSEQIQRELQSQVDEFSQKISSLEGKLLMNQEFSNNQLNNLDGSFARRSNLQNMEIQNVLTNLEAKLLKSNEISQAQVNEIIGQVQKLNHLEKQMGNLEEEIMDFTKVMANKQVRGAFGEQRLRELLINYFGNNSDLICEQVKLKNDKRVDFLFKVPNGLPLAIDVKFPLENYQNLVEAELKEKEHYRKLFINDVKYHIKVIAEKYIVTGETASQAVMFVPSEAIYYEILNEVNILEFAYQNQVWITSPTTIMAMINIFSNFHRDLKQSEKAEVIQSQLNRLGEEFIRFEKRLSDYEKRYEQLEQEREKLQITSRKLVNEFTKIKTGELVSKESEA